MPEFQLQQLQQEVRALTKKLEDLARKQEQDIRDHSHTGLMATRVNLDEIEGLYETVSVAPTIVPKSIYDQVKIYVNGATLRFYWYDGNGNAWHYITATA